MTKQSESVMASQRRKKIRAVQEFGGKCQRCGYDKCLGALVFHHLSDKKFSPSYVIMRRKWEFALEELKKCILVCSNCHAEIHFENKNIEIQSRIDTNWITKKCKYCREEFITSKESQIFCKSICAQLGQLYSCKPSKEELAELIKEKIPWRTIGNQYRVTSNTVRKWAHNYGLSHCNWIARKNKKLP